MFKWSRRAFLMAGAGTLLAACAHGQAGGIPYSIGVTGAGNEVTLEPDAQGFLMTVQSPSGIGEASVAWWGSTPPHQLSFHLKLSGLEHFRLTWSGHIVSASVNSTSNSLLQWAQLGDSGESEIDAASPCWMAIASPMEPEGGYRFSAPRAFIASTPRLWAIAWVDFYR
jgi:hypothetical protein